MQHLIYAALLLFSFACFTHAADGNGHKDEWDGIERLEHGNSTVREEQHQKVNMTELSNSISKSLQNRVGVDGGNRAPPAPLKPAQKSSEFMKRAARLKELLTGKLTEPEEIIEGSEQADLVSREMVQKVLANPGGIVTLSDKQGLSIDPKEDYGLCNQYKRSVDHSGVITLKCNDL